MSRRYERLAALSGQIAYEYDPATGRLLWGSTLLPVLGYAAADLDGSAEQWVDWIHPEDRAEALRLLRLAAETQSDYDAEYRLRHRRGHYLWCRDRGYFDPATSVRGTALMVGLVQDVSDLHRANAALRLDEQRLDALLRLSQMAQATLREISDFALEEGVRLTRSTIGYLAFVNADETVLTMHSWSHTAMAECAMGEKPLVYPVASTGLWGEAVRQRRPVITNDYAAPSSLKHGIPAGHVGLSRHLNVPVFDGDRIVAVAGVGNKAEAYDESDVRQLALLMQGMWRLVQRHRADADVRDREARFRSIVTAAPWGMHFYQLGADGRLVFGGANPAADRILGVPNCGFVGSAIEEAFPALAGTDVPERYRTIAREGGSWRWEQLAYEEGRIRGAFDVTAFQTSPGQMAAAFMDVTERRRMEAALRESEERYRGVVENSLVGICISSVEAILYANQTLIRMGGYGSLEEFRAKPVSAHLTPVSAAFANAHFAARARGEPTPREFDVEGVCRDGTVRVLRLSTSSVLLGGRRCELSTFVDVTEQRRAEAERLEMQRRLLHAQKLESLGVLAGGIAHDFNNLLMAVLGNLDMAQEDTAPSSPARDSIEQAMQASRRATDLTRMMLAYSGRGAFVTAHLDLNRLVQENAELLRTSVSRNATLRLSPAPGSVFVEADPGQVQQVVMNLITNASDAIGEAVGVVALRTGLCAADAVLLAGSRLEDKPEPGRFAYVEVADSGCGMDQATQQRLFDPFFSTKATGRGLGMSAVLGILRGHRGAIFVDSTPGRGTTIRVLFPASAHQEASRPDSATAPKAKQAAPFAGTALVVDDDDSVRGVCAALLRRLGFTVLSAADGDQALALCQEHGKDLGLVLLDLTMPGLDGVATYRELKKLRPQLGVILCSGYSESDALARFHGEGLVHFLQKPYELQPLRRSIERLLAGLPA
jgi:PAS domain S-box-containing protein